MDGIFYWFGVIHAAAYALTGFSVVTVVFVNWIVERFKLKADMLRIAHRLYRERHAGEEFHGA